MGKICTKILKIISTETLSSDIFEKYQFQKLLLSADDFKETVQYFEKSNGGGGGVRGLG